MSRKGSTPQRSVLPDPKHGSETIARFINMVMQSGKKSVAEKIVYGAMDVISEKNANAVELIEKALGNVAPAVEVKSRRVGGATYQVPVEVRSSRRHGAGNALADRIGAQAWREHACRASWLLNCWMLPKTVVARSRSAKKPTAWRKPTRRSPTTAGNPGAAAFAACLKHQLWCRGDGFVAR